MARTKNRYNALDSNKKDGDSSNIKVYKTALYARISLENAHNPSESIENQIAVMKQFIKGKHEFSSVKEYIDRSYTGTNFNRPAFEEMMEDVKHGSINCIIVKDMSRLGRDFLETSNYTEIIFPFLKVRFISVNDHYDTDKEYSGNKSLEIAMKNLVNDLYARDVSTRVSMVRKQDIKRGKFTGSNAPYGYKVDEEHPLRRYKIDEKPASVVRDIFEMVLDGKSFREVSMELQRRNINIPGEYLKTGNLYATDTEGKSKWYVGTISNIIHNEAYIGNLVQGKRRKRLCNGEKLKKVDKEEWITVADAHEPIVTKEVFDKIQELTEKKVQESCFSSTAHADIPIKPDKYAGIIYCGVCGRRLLYSSNISGKTRKRTYFYDCCDNYEIGKGKSCGVRITEKVLDAIVSDQLGKVLDMFNKNGKRLEKILDEKEKKELKPARKEKDKLARRIEDLSRKNMETYEAYVMGNCSKEDFVSEQNKVNTEIQGIRMKIILMERKEDDYIKRMEENKKWLCALKNFKNKREPDSDLICSLIGRITVYPGHEIEIRYKFKEGDE